MKIESSLELNLHDILRNMCLFFFWYRKPLKDFEQGTYMIRSIICKYTSVDRVENGLDQERVGIWRKGNLIEGYFSRHCKPDLR